MILVASGFTATRGTQPPDLPIPWFCARATDASSRPTPAGSITALENLIIALANLIVPPPFGPACPTQWTSSAEKPPPFRCVVHSARGSRCPARSALGERPDERDDVPDLLVAELALPPRHRGVLADCSASVLDRGEQVVVGQLVHQLLDGQVRDVRAEGLGLAAAILAMTARAVSQEQLLAVHHVAGLAGLGVAREEGAGRGGPGKSEAPHEEKLLGHELPVASTCLPALAVVRKHMQAASR